MPFIGEADRRVRARLHLDEDVHGGVAVGLRRRGFDVLTTPEAGNSGCADDEQLRFAIAEQRRLFTFYRGHFAQFHATSLERSEHHFGLVVAPQTEIGRVVRALARLLSERSRENLHDQLVWLSIDAEHAVGALGLPDRERFVRGLPEPAEPCYVCNKLAPPNLS